MADKVRDVVIEKVLPLVGAEPKLMEGTEKEKEEMEELLSPDSELSWDELMKKYPHANEKVQKFWAAAEATVDKDLIQASTIIEELDTIERIEYFVAIAQRRYDAIIREFDRHRFIQDQRESIHNTVEAEFKTIKPTNVPKVTKVA